MVSALPRRKVSESASMKGKHLAPPVALIGRNPVALPGTFWTISKRNAEGNWESIFIACSWCFGRLPAAPACMLDWHAWADDELALEAGREKAAGAPNSTGEGLRAYRQSHSIVHAADLGGVSFKKPNISPATSLHPSSTACFPTYTTSICIQGDRDY